MFAEVGIPFNTRHVGLPAAEIKQKILLCPKDAWNFSVTAHISVGWLWEFKYAILKLNSYCLLRWHWMTLTLFLFLHCVFFYVKVMRGKMHSVVSVATIRTGFHFTVSQWWLWSCVICPCKKWQAVILHKTLRLQVSSYPELYFRCKKKMPCNKRKCNVTARWIHLSRRASSVLQSCPASQTNANSLFNTSCSCSFKWFELWLKGNFLVEIFASCTGKSKILIKREQ